MRLKLTCTFLLAFLFFPKATVSQSIMPIHQFSDAITLDGIINEAEWYEIDPLPVVQYEPVFRDEMNERTEIRVGYDDEFLYVAGKMFTEDPSTIAANSLYRDRYSGDDVFAVILDPFNDDQNALRFFVTPAGVRFDQAISNDANSIAGSDPVNSSWNTYWDVATTQTNEGWFAEIRIPFSSIGFQSNDGRAEMGLIAYRWLAHHNERHIFPTIPPNWDRGEIKPSQAQDIYLADVEARKPIYFTPFALTGHNRINELNGDETAYVYEDDLQQDVGFDLKYNITGNLTLDVTANTDFAQVEADDQQLNLSRFSISFPEKRQFFQQRSGLFDFSFGDTKLFYSRRIGLDYAGNPVRILGGARLTGKVKDWDIGILNLQTEENLHLPSENFGVLRLKKRAFNNSSYLGGIFTNRIGANGEANIALGLDGDINIFGDDFIEMRVSQTMNNQLPERSRFNFVDNSIFRLTWQRRASNGLFYRFFINRSGRHFEPGIGFYKTKNTSDYFYRIGYGWFASENSAFKKHSVNIGSFNIFQNETFNLRSRFISLEWNSDFKDAGSFASNIRFNQEHLLTFEDFNLAGQIYIPVSNYDFFESSMTYNSPDNKNIQSSFTIGYGELYDGQSINAKIEPKWIPNIHVEFGGSYQITKLNFPEADGRNINDFTVHLSQLRGQFALNKKLSANAFFQYSNVSALAGLNFRFRYNFREGQDLWFVVNEMHYTLRDQTLLGLPTLPNIENRTILLKYTHTFQL